MASELQAYRLSGVSVTDRELGYGSYATVLELEYMGRKCAGKKIHNELLSYKRTNATIIRQFEEECRMLSQLRHPNVVEFLGVYFQEGEQVPILVMEFLPTNLTTYIERLSGTLQEEPSYSILYDVAKGLKYLHSQTPPIIHGDLTSNNILLSDDEPVVAKISDMGMATFLDTSPLRIGHIMQSSGTPAYMPPEVMMANCDRDMSVDKFSYGVLAIHVFSGELPTPQIGPHRLEDDNLIPVTEAERREVFLQALGSNHPLMDLILKCISNDPRQRPHASEIENRLAEAVLKAKLRITWKQCTNFPIKISGGMTTVINDKVYCTSGGGVTRVQAYENAVFCYDPSKDKWTALPPLPIKCTHFGLGHINGELVAVGGWKMEDKERANEIYTYNEQSRQWNLTDLEVHMPVARNYPGVLSHRSALLVAGGFSLNTVELLTTGKPQWYRTDSLPTNCCNISFVAIEDKCYVVGGYEEPNHLNKVHYASIDKLLDNAIPAYQTIKTVKSVTQSAWKVLPNTPTYQPTAAVLAGNLLAIGGKETSKWEPGSLNKREIYVYSHSTHSWIYTGDLPFPRSYSAVATLSSTEILVIGGWGDDGITNTVYKGTLDNRS